MGTGVGGEKPAGCWLTAVMMVVVVAAVVEKKGVGKMVVVTAEKKEIAARCGGGDGAGGRGGGGASEAVVEGEVIGEGSNSSRLHETSTYYYVRRYVHYQKSIYGLLEEIIIEGKI